MSKGVESPSIYEIVTAGDTVASNFPGGLSRAIRVGTGGDVVAVRQDNETVTIPNVLAGETLVIAAIRINSTNTTASGFMVSY